MEKISAISIPVAEVPPSYTKSDSSLELSKTKYRVFGVCLVSSLLVLGFLGSVYMALRPAYQEATGTLLQAEHFELNFDCQGQHHRETVRLNEDGNNVRVVDAEYGFEVTLDYDKGLALIKNTTLSECYFTRIENIPQLKKENGQFRPLLVSQDKSQVSSEMTEFARLQLSGLIPAGFLEASTGPITSVQCLRLPSYWLERSSADQSLVKRRAAAADDTVIVVVTDDEVIVVVIRD